MLTLPRRRKGCMSSGAPRAWKSVMREQMVGTPISRIQKEIDLGCIQSTKGNEVE